MHVRTDTWQQRINNVWSSDEMAYTIYQKQIYGWHTHTAQSTEHKAQSIEKETERAKQTNS